jgi:hypothetical protein
MATTYKLIETKTIATAANLVTFSSIPQTYGTLVCKISAQDNVGGAGNRTDIFCYANSDSAGSVYTNRVLFYDGANKLRGFSANQANTMAIPTAGNGANYFSLVELTIPNYTATNTKKTFHALGAFAAQATQAFNQIVVWNSTTNDNAVTSFNIQCNTSALFAVGSKFSLYGLANS